MTVDNEANESLRERALRALRANPESELLELDLGGGHQPPGSPVAATGSFPREPELLEQIQRRIQAIRTVREMGPKRACCADRVRTLEQSLMQASRDSVHYKRILAKLSEAHEEWQGLEEKFSEANDMIRSTQWLVEILADPGQLQSPEAFGEVAAAHER